MLSFKIISLACLFALFDCRVLLYDTENITSSSEKFDCVYILDNVDSKYGGSSGKIPYCQRPNITEPVTRDTNKCENGGETKYFLDLLNDGTRPSEALGWSSSVDMADQYGAFYSRGKKRIAGLSVSPYRQRILWILCIANGSSGSCVSPVDPPYPQ
jgi:hypothetical protein